MFARKLIVAFITGGALAAVPFMPAQTPEWIWSAKTAKPHETAYFRTSFTLPSVPEKAVLRVSCDNGAAVVINGQVAGRNRDWMEPIAVPVQKFLKAGENWIAVKAGNDGGSQAALLVEIFTGESKGGKRLVVSNSGWKWTANATDWKAASANLSQWQPSVVVARYGDQPYGSVFETAPAGSATAADTVTAPPGFKVDLVYTVPKAEQGSWVCLASDDKNRLLAGDQNGAIYRITLTPDGGEPKVEQLKVKTSHAQGLLYANHALYVVVNGPGSGFYRLRDTNGDDQFDEEVKIRDINGNGEHGPHQVILGPDKKSLYITGGNHTPIPNPEKSLVPRLWKEDHLLPRMWDANGHAKGILAPGGWVCRTDFEARQWTLISTGYRNEYDLAFTPDGDAFTYDSDMEWDIGSPWYRPTRICQAVPGSEFGWRSGSGKWPSYYLDSLPATVDIGPGSPTGMVAGTGAKFPAKYQRAIYALDWTYGTIYAIHLKANGASWAGDKEAFITGKPLPVTDAIILPSDRAMYFTIGGRNTQSALYRVTYVGQETTAPAAPLELTAAMKQRKDLESLLDAAPDARVVEKAWPHLGNPDRWIRFAARVVIENQPVASWQDRALAEKGSAQSTLTALCALCRAGGAALQPNVLEALGRVQGAALREAETLDLLRVYALCFTRMGKPQDPAVLAQLRGRFEPMFPAPSNALNKELCELLVFLDSRQVVPKALQLMITAKDDDHQDSPGEEVLRLNESYAKAFKEAQESRPNRQQMMFAYILRNATEGWTPDLRRQYFRWFNGTAKWRGGNSFAGFLRNIRAEALGKVPADLNAELSSISGDLLAVKKELPRAKGPGKPYDLDDLLKLAEGRLKGRNFENGRTLFQAALCSTCHRFAGEGGGVGPDLTGSGSRYTLKDLFENIVDPSKVISDQYESTLIEKTDGSSLVGRVVGEENGVLKVVENPLDYEKQTDVKVSDIKTRSKYPVSSMPPALLGTLNEDEVLDLTAFIMSGGNARDKMFQK